MNAPISKSRNIPLLLFTAPALLFYILFTVIPMIGGFVYSLTDWNGLNKTFSFLGMNNYFEIFGKDKKYIETVVFTLKYVIMMIVLQNVLALALAILIESRKKFKSIFRTIFFMPNMLSLIIGTLMWSFIFSKVVTQMAEKFSLAFLDQSWLGNPDISFYSIVIVSLWAGVGYMMVIYIAALQGVPQELREAAMIDGAGPVKNFFHITLPMIMHAVTICLFLTTNSAIKVFDVVFGLTRGGPGRATEVMTLNIYNEAFSSDLRFGYACAKAIILFFIAVVIAIIQVGVTSRKEVKV